MHNHFKRFSCIALALVLMLACTSAFACTGYYVGKDASENGTYIIGHTVDASTTFQSKQVVVPHSDEPGRTFQIAMTIDQMFAGENPELPTIPLPDTTYKYTATPFMDGNWANAVANEMGVTMTGAITAYACDPIMEADPFTEGGASEGWICAYIAAVSATAREAVENYGKVMAEYGGSESNIFFVADQNEAWYIESYTGHQWCAVKMPDDCAAVFGNEFSLGTLEAYTEGESLLHSDDLFTVPETAGTAAYDENGNMDLLLSYSGPDSFYDGAHMRTWYGHKLFAPSTVGDYNETERYDLFFKPDEKLSLSDVFEMTRSRYEGTEYDPDENGRTDMRVIAIERQATCSALEVYPDLPAEMATTNWTTLANAEHSVYLPINTLTNSLSEMFSTTPDDLEGLNFRYDLGFAHTHFKRLCALSEQNRSEYGRGVREYWKSVEDELIANYPEVLKTAADMYAEDPAAAADYITEYTIANQDKALADCDTMFDELMWYVISNTNTMKYTTGEDEHYVPSMLEVEADAEADDAAA